MLLDQDSGFSFFVATVQGFDFELMKNMSVVERGCRTAACVRTQTCAGLALCSGFYFKPYRTGGGDQSRWLTSVNLLSMNHRFLDTEKIPIKDRALRRKQSRELRIPLPPIVLVCVSVNSPSLKTRRQHPTPQRVLTTLPFLHCFQRIGGVAGEFHQKDVKKCSGDNSMFSSPFE